MQVYGLNAHGSDFWVYDAQQQVLRHFAPDSIFSDSFGG